MHFPSSTSSQSQHVTGESGYPATLPQASYRSGCPGRDSLFCVQHPAAWLSTQRVPGVRFSRCQCSAARTQELCRGRGFITRQGSAVRWRRGEGTVPAGGPPHTLSRDGPMLTPGPRAPCTHAPTWLGTRTRVYTHIRTLSDETWFIRRSTFLSR